MLRIGFDARWFNTSGVGRYVLSLLDALSKVADDDFHIFVYEHPSNPVPVEGPRLTKRAIRAAKYSLSEQIELPRCCIQDRIDVFHSPFYIIPLMAPCPVIATIHDLMPFLFPLYGSVHQQIVKTGYRVTARRADRILAVSQTTKRDLVSILGTPPEKIDVVYNAYSHDIFHQTAQPEERERLKERYGITGKYVLTLSASNWRTKNLDGAIRTLALAEQQSPVPFQSVIAGPKDGYLATGLSGLIRNQIVTGFIPEEDLPALYRNAVGFLSVSLYEGFGFPLVEAMGCGCPVLVSNGGSLPEIAAEASPSFACDDFKNMADDVVRLLTDMDYREQRSALSLNRSTHFSVKATTEGTLALYRQAASGDKQQ